jgi:hypothetical protein
MLTHKLLPKVFAFKSFDYNYYKHVGWRWGVVPRNTKPKQKLLLIFIQKSLKSAAGTWQAGRAVISTKLA